MNKKNIPDVIMKEQIILAARKVISVYGFKKTTLDDIGKVIGKGKTALYYYYKNKEEIFEAVLEYEVDLLKSELIEALENENTPTEKLKCYLNKRMQLYLKLVNFYSGIQREYLENYAIIERIRANFDKQELELIIAILKEGSTKKIFQISNLKLTAYAVILAMKGFEIHYQDIKNSQKLDKEINQLIKVLFYGIIKR